MLDSCSTLNRVVPNETKTKETQCNDCRQSCSTLNRVVPNETQLLCSNHKRQYTCSTLNRVVPNETAPRRIEGAMIFDLLAGNSLACAFWCIEFVSFHIVSWAS